MHTGWKSGGGGVLEVFAKISGGGGVKAFRKNCRGGVSPYCHLNAIKPGKKNSVKLKYPPKNNLAKPSPLLQLLYIYESEVNLKLGKESKILIIIYLFQGKAFSGLVWEISPAAEGIQQPEEAVVGFVRHGQRPGDQVSVIKL